MPLKGGTEVSAGDANLHFATRIILSGSRCAGQDGRADKCPACYGFVAHDGDPRWLKSYNAQVRVRAMRSLVCRSTTVATLDFPSTGRLL
jgi:hypothetical protein